MEYEGNFEKDTFCFSFLENQRGQSVRFKENLNIQFKSLC